MAGIFVGRGFTNHLQTGNGMPTLRYLTLTDFALGTSSAAIEVIE